MSYTKKIVDYVDKTWDSRAQFCREAGIPGGAFSASVADDNMSLLQLRRAQAILKLDWNWLMDDEQTGPPPKAGEKPTKITEAEKTLLKVAHLLCGDDPDLGLAMDRLFGKAASPAESPIASSATPERENNGTKEVPGRRSKRS